MAKHRSKIALWLGLLAFAVLVFGPGYGHAQQLLERLRKLRELRQQEQSVGTNDQRLTLEFGGLARRYNVHLPPNYSPNVPMPMVIYLHGAGGSIAGAYKDGMIEEADRLGFILAIPAGTGRLSDVVLVWNVGTIGNQACCGWAYEHHVDDVGFISAMIDAIKARFAVDARRVYVTGISNGAAMSYLLGCKLPNKIAAVAPVAAPFIPDGCRSSGPVSVIHVHGTGDLFANFNGGKSGHFAGGSGVCLSANGGTGGEDCNLDPTVQQVEFWTKKNQCTGNPQTVFRNGAASCMLYSPCTAGTQVEFCKIEGGGHTWPSGRQYAPANVIGPVSHDLSFDQIWMFLRRHSLS